LQSIKISIIAVISQLDMFLPLFETVHFPHLGVDGNLLYSCSLHSRTNLVMSTVAELLCIINSHIVLYHTVPTEAPLNVMVTVETSRSIMLSWDPPSLEQQNGILTEYHVIIMETQILYLDNGTVYSPMGNNFNKTYNVSEGRMQLVEMLHPSYNYTVMIAAATEPGIGPFSDPITVTTLEDGECFVNIF